MIRVLYLFKMAACLSLPKCTIALLNFIFLFEIHLHLQCSSGVLLTGNQLVMMHRRDNMNITMFYVYNSLKIP